MYGFSQPLKIIGDSIRFISLLQIVMGVLCASIKFLSYFPAQIPPQAYRSLMTPANNGYGKSWLLIPPVAML